MADDVTGIVVREDRQAALPLVWATPLRILPETLWRMRIGKPPLPPTSYYLHPDFARRTRLLPMPPPPPVAGVRDIQLYLLEWGNLSQRIDAWAASGARSGIEYRYPLLDRRLLEFVLGLPPEQFMRGRETRRLMLRSQREVLPEIVRRRHSRPDPVRYRAFWESLVEAFAEARSIIAAAAPPPRSRYLNMERLVRDLDPDRFRRHRRHGPLKRALQFLDF